MDQRIEVMREGGAIELNDTSAQLLEFRELTTFNAPTGHALRTILIDGEPWFIAKDVCQALGMDTISVSNKYLEGIPLTERFIGKPRDYRGIPSRGAWLVNESGFYKLVLKSRKPEALKFQDWVTGVVLPGFREDGMYVMGEALTAQQKGP